jgi:hypothetical protein
VQYTIGFRRTVSDDDGKLRRVQVRVNRPGTVVEPPERAYFAASSRTLAEAASALETERRVPATTRALTGLIPLADESLRLAVSPIAPAVGGDRHGEIEVPVVLSLHVDVPFDVGVLRETLEIETRVFDGEGRKEVLAERRTEALQARAGRSRVDFDLLSTIALRPGRYNIRVSAHSPTRNRSGSVYTDVVVPAFGRTAFSVSGVLVTAAPGWPFVLARTAQSLPVVPTSARTFVSTQHVEAFVRLYAGGSRAPGAVTVRAEIRDTADVIVFEETRTQPLEGTAAPRTADYRLVLPLDRLGPDEYLLTLTATPARGGPLTRHVRFWVE